MTLDISWRARLVEIEFASPRVAIRDRSSARRPLPGRGLSYQVRSLPVDDSPADAAARLDFPPLRSRVRYASAQRGRVVPGGLFVPLAGGYFGMPVNGMPMDVDDAPPVVIRRLPADRPSEYDARYAAVADETGWLILPPGADRRAIIEHPSETLEAGVHRFVAHATGPFPLFARLS